MFADYIDFVYFEVLFEANKVNWDKYIFTWISIFLK